MRGDREQPGVVPGRPSPFAIPHRRGLFRRRRALEAARRSEQTYRRLFQDNPAPMWIYDQGSLAFVAVNDAAVVQYGYGAEEFLQMTILDIRPEDDRPKVAESAKNDAPLDHSGPWRHQTKDGRSLLVEITSHSLTFANRPARFVMAQDVTIRHAYEEQLRHRALYDELTGLANRTVVLDRIGRGSTRAQRDHTRVAVLVLDVDRFKLINDGRGQEVGDAVLRQIASRLAALEPDGGAVGRLGADEFAVVVEDIRTDADVIAVTERIEGLFARPVAVADEDVVLSLSIGAALSAGGRPPEAVLRDAMGAVHRAKELGGGRYEIFDDAIRARTIAKLEIESALRRAIERDELCLHYQPQVDLNTDGCIGVEALVRWQHPDRGLIGPAEFVPLAEETGLVVPLGRWALHQACRQASDWNKAGFPLVMSVNLSARQLAQPDLITQVTEALDQTHLPPSQLCLELTETALMADPEGVLGILRSLGELGVQLSVDDFGTGYSSLLYLRRYPVHELKIDHAFVDGICRSPADHAIVSAVIRLGHAFGLNAVGEGIETEDQLAALRQLGCDRGQGYLWSAAVPPEEIPALAVSLHGRRGLRH